MYLALYIRGIVVVGVWAYDASNWTADSFRRDTNKNKEKNNFDNVLSKLIQDKHGKQHAIICLLDLIY